MKLPRKHKIIILILVLCPTIGEFVINGTTKSSFKYIYISPLRKALILDEYRAIKEEDEYIRSEAEKESSWILEKNYNNKTNRNIVVVIGESVRKDFLHSYGFPISNTPFISNSKNIQFNNYISVSFSTVASLLRTIVLPDSNLKDYQVSNNIVSLAKTAGYKTYWISSTKRFGIHDTPISVIADKSDSCMFITKQMNYDDDDMLPFLGDVLSKNKNNSTFFVLHMNGSHPSASDRTGGKYDEFIKSTEISCYIKTIRILDGFLKEVHLKLENERKPYYLVYFSDHGLKIEGDKLTHHGSVKDAFNPPLLLWSDTITASKQINATRVGFDFLYFISELLDVEIKNIKRNYKFISEDNSQDTNIQIVDRDGNVASYDKLKDNPASIIFQE